MTSCCSLWFGVAILVLSKIVGQLFWVTKLRPWAPRLIRPILRRLGIPHEEDFEVPLELSSKLSLTVTVVATTGIATILATDYVPGSWISSFAAGPWIPAVAGALIAPLNTLSSPTTQYILWHNSWPSPVKDQRRRNPMTSPSTLPLPAGEKWTLGANSSSPQRLGLTPPGQEAWPRINYGIPIRQHWFIRSLE